MTLRLEVEVPGASAEALWAAFTEPDRLVQWWPSVAEVDLVHGGEYVLSWPEQAWTLRGRYLEIAAPHRLAFTWAWDHEDLAERVVTVAIDDGSCSIEHEYGDDAERQGYADGWEYFLGRLSGLFE